MAKFCTNCGANLPDDKNFCTECGAVVTAEGAVGTEKIQTPPQVQQTPPVYQYQAATTGQAEPEKGSKYDPITTGGYIGIMLLMCIPFVGLILMIIWAFGGCKKVNKRNLARASLIMMAIGVVFSLTFSFIIKSVFNKVTETVGIDTNTIENIISGENNEESEATGALDVLGALAGLTSSEEANVNEEVTNSEIQELEALGDILESLENLVGEGDENSAAGNESEGGSLSDLIDEVTEINQEAEFANDGWPSSLREYPGGTAKAVASYRTEISGTTEKEMLAWIETLRRDGFEYKDFYDFGMTEEEMLEWNGWWATDGKIYLSVSYNEGTVIVDHTNELPDLSGLF